MLENGWVQKSLSPCVVSVLLVPKKYGKWRMCCDCRAINNITIKYRHPIPKLDDTLDELHDSTIFLKLISKVVITKLESKRVMSGKSLLRPNLDYESLVMPFGHTNAPITFMRLMNHVLRSCIGKYVVVYFDDILVYSNSLESHLVHLRELLLVLRNNNLFANVEKCTFCVDSVVFLCFIVNKNGVHVDPEKIKAIQE